MPVSKEFHEQIMERLSSARPIRSKAMFGGYCVYADDLVFAILDDDRVWFKFDDTNRDQFEREGMAQWAPPGSPPMGYFELPDRILNDEKELATWMDQSVGVAERKKKPKKRKPPSA